MAADPSPDSRNARALAVLRIAIGVFFLIFGEYKVVDTQFTLDGGFQFWVNRFVSDGAYPFMVPVLRDFVLPHGTAIAFLVAYGEVAIGLSLLIGVAVRWASVAGIVYMLALILSSNYPDPSNYPGGKVALWQYFGASLDHSVFALCFLVLVLGDSERAWSLTALRRRST